MSVSPIPAGYHTVTPVLVAADGDALLAFMKEALGGREHDITRMPNGRIMHGDVVIGDSHVMFSQANESFPATASVVHLYVPDTSAVYQRALAAGAQSVRPPEKQFYGDVNAIVSACGLMWSIGSRVEDVAPDEMQRRIARMMDERHGAGSAPEVIGGNGAARKGRSSSLRYGLC